jgi:hypothetical protein
MKTSKWIRVRSVRASDFGFVRRLASKQDNFTVPPLYVLWLLSRTNSRCCFVVEHIKFGPVGYLLSIPVSEPRKQSLYVWQLAATRRGVHMGAIDAVLLALRTFVRRAGVRKLLFTVDPQSPQLRAIRRYAYSLSARGIRPGSTLPKSVTRNEREYVINVA